MTQVVWQEGCLKWISFCIIKCVMKSCCLTKPCSTIKVTHIPGFVTIQTYANVPLDPMGIRGNVFPGFCWDTGSKLQKKSKQKQKLRKKLWAKRIVLPDKTFCSVDLNAQRQKKYWLSVDFLQATWMYVQRNTLLLIIALRFLCCINSLETSLNCLKPQTQPWW